MLLKRRLSPCHLKSGSIKVKSMKYTAYVVEEVDGKFLGAAKALNFEDLPKGDVLIKVANSSVNFKDALSSVGNKGVTKSYPHTPGIDAAGVVESSLVDKFSVGDEVVVIGYDLGMNTFGGFSEYIQVPAGWVIKRPSNMSATEAMAWGAAGFTAALCVDKIVSAGITTDAGAVVVSGATGGVGSVAIKLLHKLGYIVHAVTTKKESESFLLSIGASQVVSIDDFIDSSARPLQKPLYSAGIDVAGGKVLSTMLKHINYQGVVACCGLVDSTELNTTVLPFILRGVTLAGVDSVELPLELKQSIWNKMANEWRLNNIEDNCSLINLNGLTEALGNVLAGKAVGRYLVKI